MHNQIVYTEHEIYMGNQIRGILNSGILNAWDFERDFPWHFDPWDFDPWDFDPVPNFRGRLAPKEYLKALTTSRHTQPLVRSGAIKFPVFFELCSV